MSGNGRSFQYLIAFSVLLLCFKGCYGEVGCIKRERQALLLFKQGVVDYYEMLSSWENNGEDKGDCCKWRGVECENQTGHVIRLDLHGHFSAGMADTPSQFLGGKIGPSLSELLHLKHLNLSSNGFEGSLPAQLGNLSNLQSLDLSNNPAGYLRCENLDWFSGLPLLRQLDLSWVDLSKAIHWPQAINKMPSLTELNLRYTQLPPPIITNPTLVSISHINSSTSSLAVLDLSFNDLTSSIYPWLFNFNSSLVHLDLSRNRNMTCDNLDWFSDLPLLRQLSLSGVNLSKAIYWPQAINRMPSLTELFLRDAQLPPIIPSINSHINSSSTSLVVLGLSGNGITSSIYPWLFNLSSTNSLVHLDLSWNDLHGSIPDSVLNMTTLAYLDLSGNRLEGEIPISVKDLCNLGTLRLSDNNLTGLLEKDFLACSNDTLEVLDLSHNHFRGTLFPHLSGFSQLRELRLGFNQLNGTLHESIGQLPQLERLDIRSNSLQGMVSANHLFGLSNLDYLDLSYNSLTFNVSLDQVPLFQATYIMLASCKLGPRFPNWLRTQKGLMELDISASGISDAIPNWFWNLTFGYLILNMSNNHIRGTLPNLTTYWFSLGMDMSSNCLEGSVPQPLFNAAWLDLSKNKFSGSVSLSCTTTYQSISPWPLSHLDLSNNRLSGELHKCWEQWKDLTVLNLANNNFSGKINNSIGLLRHIKSLNLRNNSFIGALPSSLKNCRDLRLVDLGKNNLSGKIPAWIGESLSRLIVVNFRSNEFSGKIPLSLCQLKEIQVLDLSNNNLSGTIPKCLNNLTAMAQKGSLVIAYDEKNHGDFLPSYIDNTQVQWKGKEAEYKETLGLVKSIDFSNNKITGEIPPEVTDLVELVALNISRNNLIGPIPSGIGQLKLLDFLDLSQNRLDGGIPNSLAQIAGLSVLDLSNNNLSGKIPSGTQLQSFNASAYEGNPGLCGPPLLKRCSEDEDKSGESSFTGLSSKKDDIQDGANNIWFYGNIVLGFSIGFWGVCGTLLLHSSWRYAYFKFLNKIKDLLYVATVVSMNRIRRSFQS